MGKEADRLALKVLTLQEYVRATVVPGGGLPGHLAPAQSGNEAK
jgi:hypothetical protein